MKNYDIIIVGGGHAGTEAALAAARMGASTLLLTQNIDTLGQMSCNPAVGGIGKGHLVKEIDALGGVMAWATDLAGIQFRRLNASKGPAVRATRAQTDRMLYRQAIRQAIEAQENLQLFQQSVIDLIVENSQIKGVVTQMGLRFSAPCVVLTVGTFLGGKIHIGNSHYAGGRAGDAPSIALAERLRELPFRVDRLKTGTPPRIDGKTVDYSQLDAQAGDDPIPTFSLWNDPSVHPQQIPCHITHTNEKCHDIIREGLKNSPLYSGAIEGVGPRYCPSIEDKIVRFADKKSHQIFIEPEGLTAKEIYPNGISTSLDFECQQAFVKAIKGFENAHITRPGYAIEYDFFDPRDLQYSLETKFLKGLYFAGQINGTTGYEEAAAQGLMAGINAALKIQGKDAWCPRRDEAYIGVLIDDLITRGTLEPYRMFTSRAEYRLSLREDNADLRLTPKGRELGLINDAQWQMFTQKRDAIEMQGAKLKTTWIKAESPQAKQLEKKLPKPLQREYNLFDLLRRPELNHEDIAALDDVDIDFSVASVAEQIEIQAKYAGYIERQLADIDRMRRHEDALLPEHLHYETISGLSSEIIQKLTEIKPKSLGQASRISGVTPAAISLLAIYLKKSKKSDVA